MWSLYLFVNKLLNLEEDVRNRSEEDGSDLAESCSFQISAVCELNHDVLLPRSHYVKVPHVSQLYDWDCGLACILMVFQTVGISGYDLHTLEMLCSTRSIWTVDLAYLLQKFSICFSYFTVTLGANPDFSMETYYKDQLPNDLDRVDMLFKKALEAGIEIERRSICREEISFLILSGKYIAIVLVDQYKLSHPWLENTCVPGIYDSYLGYTGYFSNILVDVLSDMSSHPWLENTCVPGIYDSYLGYTGHYVVICGYDAESDEFEIRDPASSRERVRLPSKCLDDARKSFGTDEDLLLISLDQRPGEENMNASDTC